MGCMGNWWKCPDHISSRNFCWRNHTGACPLSWLALNFSPLVSPSGCPPLGWEALHPNKQRGPSWLGARRARGRPPGPSPVCQRMQFVWQFSPGATDPRDVLGSSLCYCAAITEHPVKCSYSQAHSGQPLSKQDLSHYGLLLNADYTRGPWLLLHQNNSRLEHNQTDQCMTKL